MSKSRDAVEDIRTIDTVTATANAALPKAGGALTGTVTNFTSTGIDDNATSTAITIDASEIVTVGSTVSPALKVNRQSANGDAYIELQSNGTKVANLVGSSVGGFSVHTGASGTLTTALSIDNAGIVTKPLQPAFQARTAQVANLPINQTYTVPYGTEVFDQNADYNPATYTFTAPVTGKYQLNASIYLNNVVVASGYVEFYIATSNKNYYSILSVNGFDTDLLYFTIPHTVLADMDAGDTAKVNLWLASGSQTADLQAETYFSGSLIC